MSTLNPPVPRDIAATRPSGDPHHLGHAHHGHGHTSDEATGHGEGGPASKRVVTAYGFWIFLLSDIVMFSGFFAAYAVLADGIADGPAGPDIFELDRIGLETALLLASSYSCGLASIATYRRNILWTQIWLLITGLLGVAFLILEIEEFRALIEAGAGPGRSAFLSAFFALVGCHGLHVGVGLLWLGTMMAQLLAKGFRPDILRRLLCFNLFWHALDIIWVALFTVVYLMGIS